MPTIAVESKEEILAEIDLVENGLSIFEKFDFDVMSKKIENLKKNLGMSLRILKSKVDRNDSIEDEANRNEDKAEILRLMDNMELEINKLFKFFRLGPRVPFQQTLKNIAQLKKKISAYLG